MKTFLVAEDCAGLATGTTALKHTIAFMRTQTQKRKMQTSGGNKKSKVDVSGKRIKVDNVYMSELDLSLRCFLKQTYPRKNIVDNSELGVSDKGDRLLGLDGRLDIFISGGCCAPFSKKCLNKGISDKRAESTIDSVNFIIKRFPSSSSWSK